MMYDAIVVGARCAGTPTAMLLARKGYRVLLVDKATVGSDTISTHMFHQAGILYLKRWGLLPRLLDAGTPLCRGVTFFMDGAPMEIPPEPVWGVDGTYAPRRTVLDRILVEAAVEQGVELRERFSVSDLVVENGAVAGIRGREAGGREVTERAPIVVGADGKNSLVARVVKASRYRARAAEDCGFYGYWSGIDGMTGYELHSQADVGGALAAATNDGLVCIVTGGFELERFMALRADARRVMEEHLDKLPALADRVRAGRLETRMFAWKDAVNCFRVPAGPGWALVGDAGYYKHPVTGLGMSDAFRDAEALADAIDDGLSERRPMHEALADYGRARDAASDELYDTTHDVLATSMGPDRGAAAFGRLTELSRAWSRRVETMGYLDEPEPAAV